MELDYLKLPRFKADAFKISNLIPQWAEAYEVSTAAIVRQIPIAHAWADSNPKKAPKTNVTRFLHTWMRNAKKYGNLVSAPVDRAYHDNPPEADMTIEEMQEIRRRNMKRVA